MGVRDPLDVVGDLLHVLRDIVLAAAIEVLADQVHVIGATGEHAPGPAPLPRIAHVAAADRLDGRVHLAHLLLDPVVLEDIVTQLHVAELPVAPHLVAHAPPLDAEGLGVAVLGPPLAHRGVGRAVGVLDLGGRRIGVAEPGVDRDHGLRLDQLAEANELMHAHVVGLDPGPRRIGAGRSLVPVAQAVPPVIAAHEVAARPPIHRGVELPEQFERVLAETLDVVGGHQGHAADLQLALAGWW